MIGIIIVLLCTLALAAYRYVKLVQANGDLQQLANSNKELETKNERLEKEFQEALLSLEGVQVQQRERIEQVTKTTQELDALRQEQTELTNSLSLVKGQVQNEFELLRSYKNACEQVQATCNERCQEAQQQADARLAEIEQECARLIGERRMAAQAIVDQLAENAETERQKYLSIVAAIQNTQTSEEKEQQRHICIKEVVKDDIGYLLNNVSSHLSNPDILYKLIWSEYIQKPTNEMLDYVLPNKDCAGIYKITNDRNKKSYIGRSTSVRKRLTDHVKSTIGISTIANQKIHDIMREEGLWNFSFELLEECDKDCLNEREKYYINFFQTVDNIYGYNQKAGG